MAIKSKALKIAEARIVELEAQIAAENRADKDWNICDCATCVTIRKHQATVETIDEILVLAGTNG